MPADTSKTKGTDSMEDLAPIWQRIDKQSVEIAELKENHKLIDYRVTRHEREMSNLASKTQETVNQILTEIKHIGDKVRNNELNAAYNKGADKGKLEATTWKRWFIGLLVPSLLTIAGLAYAALK